MADQDTSKPGPNRPPKKEFTVEQRLLLAFALMGLVLFATQFLYKSPQDQVKPVKPATPQQAVKPPEVTAPAAVPPPSAQQIAAQKAEAFTIDTDVFRVTFNNHGAVVRSWQLKQYKDGTGRPLELVNAAAASKTHYPLSLLFESQKPASDL